MKTEKEIKEQIQFYKELIESKCFPSEVMLAANGAKTALEWVLKEGEE